MENEVCREKELLFVLLHFGGGGAERVVANLSRALTEYGRHLTLFQDERAYEFAGEVSVLDTPILGKGPKFEKVGNLVRAWFQLRQLKASKRPNTSISFLTWPNIVNVVSRVDERVVLSVRSNPSEGIRGKFAGLRKWLVRQLYPKADTVVAISEGVRRELIENYGVSRKSAVTIYNPVEHRKIIREAKLSPPKAIGGITHDPLIVTMGRLEAPKGHWHLIRAFRELKKSRPDARLLIMGTGSFSDYLMRLARESGLKVWKRDTNGAGSPVESDVMFWGFEENPFPILAASDVFAFSSLWEGLGNVILESMACGTPVVSADCRFGPRELLAPDTGMPRELDRPEWGEYGMLLPVCDGELYDAQEPLTLEERIWARGLDQMLGRERRREEYAVKGRERVKDFGPEHIGDEWRRVLNTCSR